MPLNPISNLTNLRKLNISFSRVDLTPILKLTHLQELVVSHGQNLDKILELLHTIKENGGKITITDEPNLFN